MSGNGIMACDCHILVKTAVIIDIDLDINIVSLALRSATST
jgi:hypothetical protein